MIRRLVAAVDERLAGRAFLRSALRKAFPDHWSFMLGEIALYCFLILVATGVYLSMLFEPSDQKIVYQGALPALHGTAMSAAYASVLRISFEVPAGLLVRQIHHWTALVFLAAVVVHMSRIFFTGAFRRPREINWILGLSLFMLVTLAGFTGYSLPGDLLSGTGLRIAYSVAESIPLIGVPLAFLLFGGAYPSPVMTQRLFALHILVLPVAIGTVIALHLAIVWRQKHTQFAGPGRTEHNVVGSPLWPHYAFKSLALLCCVAGVVSLLAGLVQINPVWIYGPYDPESVSAPAQPDWYVGWLEGALRIWPAWDLHVFGADIPPVFWPGVVLPLLLFSVLFAWPFFERAVTHDARVHHLLDLPSDAPWRTAAGAALLGLAAIFTLAGSDDIQAAHLRVPVESLVSFYRAAAVAAPLLAAAVAYRVAREIALRRARMAPEDNRVVLARDADGGFVSTTERDAASGGAAR